MSSTVDITLVTDPRFLGGTAEAFLTDALAFLADGLRLGVIFHRSGNFFKATDPDNHKLLELSEKAGVTVNPTRTESLFFHNPQVFGPTQIRRASSLLPIPESRRCFLVAHHPPFMGNGALSYDPISTTSTLRFLTGKPIEWLPVSGLVRQQISNFSPFIQVSKEDWVNSFPTVQWQARRPKLQTRSFIIGRHGRPHPDKWPKAAQDISASLPENSETAVRILGADPGFFENRKVDTSGWQILPFGAMDVRDYLDQLDVFSYFHSECWREAFGRTIAEAMMMNVRCILDPALRPTFGHHALYCRPDEVAQVLNTIRQDLDLHRTAATAAGDWCRRQFSTDEIGPRYERLMAQKPLRFRSGKRDRSALVTTRKWLGYKRREAKTGIAL